MKYFATIQRGNQQKLYVAETPSRLAEAISGDVEHWVDTKVTFNGPSFADETITITAFSKADIWKVNEQTGELESDYYNQDN